MFKTESQREAERTAIMNKMTDLAVKAFNDIIGLTSLKKYEDLEHEYVLTRKAFNKRARQILDESLKDLTIQERKYFIQAMRLKLHPDKFKSNSYLINREMSNVPMNLVNDIPIKTFASLFWEPINNRSEIIKRMTDEYNRLYNHENFNEYFWNLVPTPISIFFIIEVLLNFLAGMITTGILIAIPLVIISIQIIEFKIINIITENEFNSLIDRDIDRDMLVQAYKALGFTFDELDENDKNWDAYDRKLNFEISRVSNDSDLDDLNKLKREVLFENNRYALIDNDYLKYVPKAFYNDITKPLPENYLQAFASLLFRMSKILLALVVIPLVLVTDAMTRIMMATILINIAAFVLIGVLINAPLLSPYLYKAYKSIDFQESLDDDFERDCYDKKPSSAGALAAGNNSTLLVSTDSDNEEESTTPENIFFGID
ncbi:MAG: hypothetical protein P1U74_08530 [Legionellaceae bacterium]|nr:hypothetical protein [Legionellaceae bacterium]